jgi:hypothetical protein
MKKHELFARTVARLPEWQAWVRDNQVNHRFNTAKVEKTGAMGTSHLEEFIAFAVKQRALQLILLLREHVAEEGAQLEQSITRITNRI